jgi:hypothetical protein
MSLLELQRRVAAAIMAPGAPARAEVTAFVKPNARLTARERLDIYRDSYWQRILDSFEDDFPGLRAILGLRAFQRLARSYLADTPSQSFTMRNLGARLEEWLRCHPEFAGPDFPLALDMVRLEWAHIEAFDAAEVKPLGPEDLLEPGPDLRLGLQPSISLLELQYPVDDLRIRLEKIKDRRGVARRIMRQNAQTPEPIHLAVHRQEYVVFYRRLAEEEYRILDALRRGVTLVEAVEGTSAPDRVEAWFAAWSRMGWLCHPEKISA